ncbi:MAG: hypothetical protein IJF29_02075 [Firmicutes bacterium]|nr:hypothetical protein [Bacillota bacterium]
MKKVISMIIVISLILVPNGFAFASEINHEHNCSGLCDNDILNDMQAGTNGYIDYKQEVTVIVDNYFEFLRYPKNPDYKYTFVINEIEPLNTRAVCYMCGRSSLGTASYLEETNTRLRACPSNAYFANDVFMEWTTFRYELCSACGYESEPWESGISYTAQCKNDNTPADGGDWIVKYEYTQSAGYDLHQSLRWWTEYSEI